MTGSATEIIEWLMSKDKDLTFDIDIHREKRSLNANSYSWVLISKIAKSVGTSKEEVYESMLQSYGTLDEEFPPITVIAEADMTRIGHFLCIGTHEQGGKKFKSYMRIKGSSECNTKEMSKLIDGIVYEAKELGIETLTPLELEKLKATINDDVAIRKKESSEKAEKN